jgi:zinc/manganese transport system permease protein
LSNSAEGNEELRRTLIGEVLLVTPRQVGGTFALFVVIGIVHFIFRKQFLAISFEPAKARGFRFVGGIFFLRHVWLS